MSIPYNFVTVEGVFERLLLVEERKTTFNAVFRLVKMQWRDDDIDEESFKNGYKFWIASENDVKDVDFKVKEQINKFLDENESKFKDPIELKKMDMFQGSDYVCVVKNAIYYNPNEMQTARIQNLVYFRNESPLFKVRYILSPSVEKTLSSSTMMNAAIEGGYKGLLQLLMSAERTSKEQRTDNKGITDRVVEPGKIDNHNCPDGKGNYCAFVYDDQYKDWVYFQSGYVKKSVAKRRKRTGSISSCGYGYVPRHVQGQKKKRIWLHFAVAGN
ncbi:hypothetical protein AAMO2058_001718000 [Amorphochlora amoebiformis]